MILSYMPPMFRVSQDIAQHMKQLAPQTSLHPITPFCAPFYSLALSLTSSTSAPICSLSYFLFFSHSIYPTEYIDPLQFIYPQIHSFYSLEPLLSTLLGCYNFEILPTTNFTNLPSCLTTCGIFKSCIIVHRLIK